MPKPDTTATLCKGQHEAIKRREGWQQTSAVEYFANGGRGEVAVLAQVVCRLTADRDDDGHDKMRQG